MDVSRFNLECKHCEYVEANPAIFRGNAKPTREQIDFLYLTYNEIYKDSKKPSGCGACLRNTIDGIYRVTQKYCQELCQQTQDSAQEKTGKETLQADQKAPRTSKRKPSEKRTKSSSKGTSKT